MEKWYLNKIVDNAVHCFTCQIKKLNYYALCHGLIPWKSVMLGCDYCVIELTSKQIIYPQYDIF